MGQDVRYCVMPNGHRVAYATAGEGPPLVVIPGWIAGMAIDTQVAGPALAARQWLERHHTVIRYDRYGAGLSERARTDFSLEADVQALEAVVQASGLKRFTLWGGSAGGPAAVAYAAKYPRRVSHLLLIGSLARSDPAFTELLRALSTLIRVNWGIASKTIADLFMPGAPPTFAGWFAEVEQQSASAEVAMALWNLEDVDVSDACRRVRAPTLVLHREGDKIIPFRLGQDLAALIPQASFVPLPGDAHMQGWSDPVAMQAIAGFLGDSLEDLTTTQTDVTRPLPVTPSEVHQVFLSYASHDHETAEAVLRALEEAGIRCWIAPRDIRPGQDYAEAIVEAVRGSRAMVVVFSAAANRSPHVRREMERATSADLPIIPLRIEDVTPSAAMEYFLSTPHWLNAFSGPLEPHLRQLTATIRTLLQRTTPSA